MEKGKETLRDVDDELSRANAAYDKLNNSVASLQHDLLHTTVDDQCSQISAVQDAVQNQEAEVDQLKKANENARSLADGMEDLRVKLSESHNEVENIYNFRRSVKLKLCQRQSKGSLRWFLIVCPATDKLLQPQLQTLW